MGELQGEIGPSKKSAPSLETTPALIARCQTWYTRSIMHYMLSRIKQGLPKEEPQNILVVSHGGWITTLLSTLVTMQVVMCGKGVQFGRCLNTGVSIVEYTGETAGRNGFLMGTLVQYSNIEHLKDKDLRYQEVNADELVDQGSKP
jgi:probable phosphoglycerate mutase